MHPTKIKILRLTWTAGLVLVALAFATGAAGAPQAEKFTPGVTDFPSRLGEVGERAAEARLAQQEPPVYVQIEDVGFDWSAAATGAIAATFLLLATALTVRTAKRSRVALG
jgi:hypothetical protein